MADMAMFLSACVSIIFTLLLHKVNLSNSEGSLWIFGGYSFTQGGPLNDIRAFDTKNVSWLPITVHFTADIPKERYFHAWELGMVLT